MSKQYDIALTFAGEDRAVVMPIAEKLKSAGYAVFYDRFETADLWGRNLVDYLHDVYLSRANYCVIFVSKHYIEKAWTNLERRAAQARAFAKSNEVYILPIRIDESSLSGMPETVGYLNISLGTDSICDLLSKKIGHPMREGGSNV